MPRDQQPPATSNSGSPERKEESTANTLRNMAFDALYARITAPASRAAADAVFEAAEDDLGRHHRPGDTEGSR